MRRLAVLVLGFGLISCGVPTDDQATPIDLDEVSGLFVTTTTTTTPQTDVDDALVFFVGSEASNLVGAVRKVPRPVTAAGAVEALLGGTTEEEEEVPHDLRTAIPQGTELLGSAEVDGVLVLNFNEVFTEAGEAQGRAFAQVVWTVEYVDPDDEARIEFRIEGVPQPVQTEDGEVVSRCVNQHDFSTFDPFYVEGEVTDRAAAPTDCDFETGE